MYVLSSLPIRVSTLASQKRAESVSKELLHMPDMSVSNSDLKHHINTADCQAIHSELQLLHVDFSRFRDQLCISNEYPTADGRKGQGRQRQQKLGNEAETKSA